jgi:hypothetical protein
MNIKFTNCDGLSLVFWPKLEIITLIYFTFNVAVLVTLLLSFRKTQVQISTMSRNVLTGDLWCFSVPQKTPEFVLHFLQHIVIVFYRRFGSTYLSHVQGSGSPLTFEEKIDTLSRNVGNKLPFYAAQNPRKAQILFTLKPKPAIKHSTLLHVFSVSAKLFLATSLTFRNC